MIETDKNLKHITLEIMLHMLVTEIITNYENGSSTFFWKNGDDEFEEIIEVDLMRGRFITETRDFSEFEWELEESRIYVLDE